MKKEAGRILIALTVLTGGAAGAVAQDRSYLAHAYGEGFGRHMLGHSMRETDLNGDGDISLAEAEAMRTVRFLTMDLDSDGAVTEAEMIEAAQRRIAEHIAKRFARMDANGDGRIDRAEYDDRSAARIAEADADGNGRITRDEMRERKHAWRHSRGGDEKKPEN